MATRLTIVPVLAGALLCTLPRTGFAQPEPLQRPFRGLFGASRAGGGQPGNETAAQQTLVLTLSGFGSYDDDVLSVTRNTPDPRAQQAGYFTTGSAQLSYVYATERFGIGSDVSAQTRYHPDQADLTALSLSAGTGLYKSLGTRTRVELGARAFKAPRYHLGLLSSPLTEDVGFDGFGDAYALSRMDGFGLSANGSISQKLTTRTSVDASYGYRVSEYSSVARRRTRQQAGTGIRHRVTAYSTARLAYRYQTHGVDITGQPIEEHNFIAGVDFSRPWSLSGRRTELTIHPGWSVVRTSAHTRLTATGSAQLTHQLGRSWTAQAEYARGMRFIDALDVYTLSDQVLGGVNGLVGRRIDLLFTAAFATGRYGPTSAGRFDTYTGRAQVRYALTSMFAAFGQYFYYVYDFNRPELLPTWFNQTVERQGIRVGLTAQVPLFR